MSWGHRPHHLIKDQELGNQLHFSLNSGGRIRDGHLAIEKGPRSLIREFHDAYSYSSFRKLHTTSCRPLQST